MEPGKLLVLLDHRAGSRDSTTPFVTEDNDEGDTKMLGSIFDRPHRVRIDDIAGVTGDKKFA
jgi:hypothetical protein